MGYPMKKATAVNVDQYLHSCPNDCGCKYKHKSSLSKHLKFECGVEKQFKCLKCGNRFTLKHHLITHMLSIHKMVHEK